MSGTYTVLFIVINIIILSLIVLTLFKIFTKSRRNQKDIIKKLDEIDDEIKRLKGHKENN